MMTKLTTAALTLLLAFGTLLTIGGTASANPIAGSGYSSSYAGESVFENKAAGESGQFSAIFFNDGTQSWLPGVVGLLVCLPDKTTCNVGGPNTTWANGWYSTTVYATLTATVAPGQNGFFIYNWKVPAGTPAGTVTTFNGDVGLIATGTMLRPEGYYHVNTTPSIAGTLTISPTSATMAVNGQQTFTATTSLTGTVSWSVTGGCGAITGTGLFVATATNSATQPCTVKATIGSLTAEAPITVYGVAASLACTASPSNIVAGGGTNGTSTLTVAVKDVNGNTVVTSAPSVTITNATPTFATLSASGSLAPTNGVVTLTVTSTTTTGQIVVSASSASITGCTALITSGSAGTSARTTTSFVDSTSSNTSSGPIGADGSSTVILRVDVQDASGNRVTTDDSDVIDVSLTSGAGVCTVVGVATGTSGSAGGGSGTATTTGGRVEFTIRSTTTPGFCTFTAVPRNTAIASSAANLTTQIVGSATQVGITGNDSPHAAGSASTTTITAAIKDANGSRVTSSSLAITATKDTSTCTGAGGGDVVTASSGTTSGGAAVFTFTSNGAYSGCRITFTASGLSGTTAVIVFTPGAGDHLGCAFSPTTMAANGSNVAIALVKLKDQVGNDVNSGSYSINFSRTGGDGITSIQTSNPQTMTNGVVVFQVKATSTAGTDTYTPSLYTGTLPTVTANTTCSINTT